MMSQTLDTLSCTDFGGLADFHLTIHLDDAVRHHQLPLTAALRNIDQFEQITEFDELAPQDKFNGLRGCHRNPITNLKGVDDISRTRCASGLRHNCTITFLQTLSLSIGRSIMKKSIDAITATQTATADTAVALMRNTLDVIERLAALNLNTLRETLENSAEQSKKLAGTKDLAQVSAAVGQPSMEKTRAYYHQVYDLMSEMQEQLTKVMQAHYNTLSETASSATADLAANTPVGGEAFAAAMKAVLDANAQAFERINETAHQLQAGTREIGESLAKKSSPAKSATAKAATSSRSKKA